MHIQNVRRRSDAGCFSLINSKQMMRLETRNEKETINIPIVSRDNIRTSSTLRRLQGIDQVLRGNIEEYDNSLKSLQELNQHCNHLLELSNRFLKVDAVGIPGINRVSDHQFFWWWLEVLHSKGKELRDVKKI